MERATFVATGTALEDSGMNTDIRMKLDCLIKTNGKNNDDLLRGNEVVGRFDGTSCSAIVKKGDRVMIFFDRQSRAGRVYLKLNSVTFESQAISIPTKDLKFNMDNMKSRQLWAMVSSTHITFYITGGVHGAHDPRPTTRI